MTRQFFLRLTAFLLLATFASSASACCLLPFLNPFAWCGYGCGTGCYGAGYGYSAWSPWYGSGYGGGCCGYGGYGGYQSYSGSIYTPGYSHGYGAPGSDCNCGAATGPAVVPQATPSAGPGTTWNTQPTPWSGRTAWQVQPQPQQQYQWTPGPVSWRPGQYGVTGPAVPQQTTMSTAPIYGPSWEVPSPAAGYQPQVAGDIRGDHEFHAIPNAYRGGPRPPIHRASFQRLPRTTRRYSRSVH